MAVSRQLVGMNFASAPAAFTRHESKYSEPGKNNYESMPYSRGNALADRACSVMDRKAEYNPTLNPELGCLKQLASRAVRPSFLCWGADTNRHGRMMLAQSRPQSCLQVFVITSCSYARDFESFFNQCTLQPFGSADCCTTGADADLLDAWKAVFFL